MKVLEKAMQNHEKTMKTMEKHWNTCASLIVFSLILTLQTLKKSIWFENTPDADAMLRLCAMSDMHQKAQDLSFA